MTQLPAWPFCWREIVHFRAALKLELSLARFNNLTSPYNELSEREVDSVTYSRQPLGWTPFKRAETRSGKTSRGRPRLAAALGVEPWALELVLATTGHTLSQLRALSLTDLLALKIRTRDAERLFYLVQWERLQEHLERHGELPERDELEPLLATLNPIFIRHFSRSERLSETLIALYRSELSGRTTEKCLNLTPPNPASRLLRWLGFA